MKNILLSTAALVFTTSVAFADTVRMGTEGAYPPYNFVNDNGDLDGYEIVLGNELCKRAELTCEWVQNDWDSIITNLNSGNYDTIIAGMSITDERKEVIDFSQNYTPPAASAYLALSADVDLTSGVVAAQAATIQAGYIAESGAILVEFATPDETVAAVKNGEADAVFADGDYLYPIAAESGGDMLIVGEPVGLGGGIGIGMRKSDTELKAKFNTAIDSMKADGTLNALITEWFGADAQVF